MYWNIVLVLAGLLQISAGYPVSGASLHYEPGKTYKYAYTTETLINELLSTRATAAQKDVGFSLSTHIQLTPIWSQGDSILVKLVVSNPKLHSVAQENIDKELKGLPRLPIYFQWTSGKVVRVYAAEDDPTLTTNLKKGIISLFQLHGDKGERNELDASGDCKVSYKVKNDVVTKTKLGCDNLETVGEFKSVHPLLEPVLKGQSETEYKIGDDIIQSAVGSESFETYLNLDRTLSTSVTVKQKLKMEGASKGKTYKGSKVEDIMKKISKESRLTFYSTTLASTFEAVVCTDNCEKASTVISQNRDAFLPGNQSSTSAAEAYMSLVRAVRKASKAEVTKILNNGDNKEIIEAVLDGVVGAQTKEAQEAIMEFLNFNDAEEILLAERYLLAVAFSTHPSEKLMQDLFGLFNQNVPNEKLRESVGEALGATLYAYCRMGHWQSQLVKDIQKAILEKMAACSGETETSCVAMMLRALMNAGMPETIPTLLNTAETSKDSIVSETAVKSLRRMGEENLRREEVRSSMKRIFHQTLRGFDSPVRSQALNNILTTGVSEDELRTIVRESNDPWNMEYDMYIQATLYNLMEQDQDIKTKMVKILKEEEFRNWNFLAPKGKALTFTGYLARVPPPTALDSTYFMYVENSRPGIMKRSGMDVVLNSPVQKLPVYNFGIFAAGLENLLGEEVEAGQEDIEVTAGISLDLIDVSLRPISFFHGQSQLMGAVWSAPSEPTSALQGNMLLLDHASRLHLQNGLVVQVQVAGALSMDLSGSMSLSLWNKNCKTLIQNSGAIVLQGSTSIETSPFRAGVTFDASGAARIDFQTDVDFYDGIKMCLQMGRPDYVFKREVRKFEKAQGFKKSFKARIRRNSVSPGISYPLPKRNNKQCRAMLAQD